MKFIQILFLALLPVFGSAQLNYEWETVEIVDEFGDPTGDVAKSVYCEGVFSNSATSNSDLIARVSDQSELIVIQLYEYASPPSVSMGLGDERGKIKVKRADGTVEEFGAWSPKGGGLYFSKDLGRDFIDLVINGGGEEITVLVKEEDFSEYGSASYRFTVTMYLEIVMKVSSSNDSLIINLHHKQPSMLLFVVPHNWTQLARIGMT